MSLLSPQASLPVILPPNSAIIGYVTEEAPFISAQIYPETSPASPSLPPPAPPPLEGFGY